VDEERPAETHGLEERGMRAADLRRVHVEGGVCEELAIRLAVYRARQQDARVARRLCSDAREEGVRIGRRAHEDELRLARNAPERPHDGVGVVLRLEARDVKDVAPGFESKPLERREPGRGREIRAIRNVDGILSIGLAVIGLDRAGVRHDDVRQHARETLRKRVGELSESIPLSPVSFEAVHVQDDAHRRSEEPGQTAEEGVHAVADEHRVVALGRGVEARKRRVDDGVEVLPAQRRKMDDARAAMGRHDRGDAVRPRVNRDVVPPRGEAGGELFGKRLEPAVRGGNSARAKYRDLHAPARRAPSGSDVNHGRSARSVTVREARIAARFATRRARFSASQ
jgi:hypothetical protein